MIIIINLGMRKWKLRPKFTQQRLEMGSVASQNPYLQLCQSRAAKSYSALPGLVWVWDACRQRSSPRGTKSHLSQSHQLCPQQLAFGGAQQTGPWAKSALPPVFMKWCWNTAMPVYLCTSYLQDLLSDPGQKSVSALGL